jgi:hypothetical protein
MFTKADVYHAYLVAVERWMKNHYEETEFMEMFRGWAVSEIFLRHKFTPDSMIIGVPMCYMDIIQSLKEVPIHESV